MRKWSATLNRNCSKLAVEPWITLMMPMSREDYRGSRIGCLREHAGGTPATTALVWGAPKQTQLGAKV
jgi:hypothetical protein